MRVLLDTNVVIDLSVSRLPWVEDAPQTVCALRYRLDAIVTRDATGFAGAPVAVWTPEQLLAALRADSY